MLKGLAKTVRYCPICTRTVGLNKYGRMTWHNTYGGYRCAGSNKPGEEPKT